MSHDIGLGYLYKQNNQRSRCSVVFVFCQAAFPELEVAKDSVRATIAGVSRRLKVPIQAFSLKDAAERLNIFLKAAKLKQKELLPMNRTFVILFVNLCYVWLCEL
jgi:hypothetical protein